MTCLKIYEGKNEDPPCSECMPELMDENKEAAEVYNMVKGQYITIGQGEPVDISFQSIIIAMDMLEVQNRKNCFIKVLDVSRTIIGEERENANMGG